MEEDGIIPMFVHEAHKFSKILEATPKFYVPEGLNEASSILKSNNSVVTCEPHCYLLGACQMIHTFACTERTASILLKYLAPPLKFSSPGFLNS